MVQPAGNFDRGIESPLSHDYLKLQLRRLPFDVFSVIVGYSASPSASVNLGATLGIRQLAHAFDNRRSRLADVPDDFGFRVCISF